MKDIFIYELFLEFHFFMLKLMKQYFVKLKMKFSFQQEHSRILKFQFSICCKVRVIGLNTLHLFKFSISNGLIVKFCSRKSVYAAERKNQVNQSSLGLGIPFKKDSKLLNKELFILSDSKYHWFNSVTKQVRQRFYDLHTFYSVKEHLKMDIFHQRILDVTSMQITLFLYWNMEGYKSQNI